MERGEEMTSAEKKEWLLRYIDLKAECEDTLEQIEEWTRFATRCTAAISAAPGGGGGSSKVETGAVAIADISQKMCGKLRDLATAREEIAESVENVDDPIYRRILRMRYISGLKWGQIEERTKMSRREIFRTHGEALLKFEPKIWH